MSLTDETSGSWSAALPLVLPSEILLWENFVLLEARVQPRKRTNHYGSGSCSQ